MKCNNRFTKIPLFPYDIQNIAEELNLSVKEFIEKHTYFALLEDMEEHGTYFYTPFVLIKTEKGCPFHAEGYCLLNHVPTRCRNNPLEIQALTLDYIRNLKEKHYNLEEILKVELPKPLLIPMENNPDEN